MDSLVSTLQTTYDFGLEENLYAWRMTEGSLPAAAAVVMAASMAQASSPLIVVPLSYLSLLIGRHRSARAASLGSGGS